MKSLLLNLVTNPLNWSKTPPSCVKESILLVKSTPNQADTILSMFCASKFKSITVIKTIASETNFNASAVNLIASAPCLTALKSVKFCPVCAIAPKGTFKAIMASATNSIPAPIPNAVAAKTGKPISGAAKTTAIKAIPAMKIGIVGARLTRQSVTNCNASLPFNTAFFCQVKVCPTLAIANNGAFIITTASATNNIPAAIPTAALNAPLIIVPASTPNFSNT